MSSNSSSDSNIYPERILENLWVFPPNKEANGSTAWWLDCDPEPILIDCPPVSKTIIEELRRLSGKRKARIFLTNRNAHGNISELQNQLGWPVTIQEQEAYLLPLIKEVETFSFEHTTVSGVQFLWTPGPSPGSSIAYSFKPLNVMFCGRLLLPVSSHRLSSLRTENTFHWTTQQKSLKRLREWVSRKPLPRLASGSHLGRLGSEKILPWKAWKEL